MARILSFSTLLGIAFFLSACPDPPDEVPQVILDMEQEAFDLLNIERSSLEIDALAMRRDLREVARAHSQDMIDRDFFDHVNPDGDSPFVRMDNAGIDYNGAGENIARNNFADPVARAVEGWMDSTGHRENILRESFTHTGMGVATDGSGMYWFTQVFITEAKTSESIFLTYRWMPSDPSLTP